MRTPTTHLFGIVAVVLVGALSAPTKAVTITHDVNGPLAHDDFEADTLGEAPPTPPWESYFLGAGGSSSVIEVIDDTTTHPGPAPLAGGDQYLHVFTDDKSTDRAELGMHFASQNSGTVHSEWWMYTLQNGPKSYGYDPKFGFSAATPDGGDVDADYRMMFLMGSSTDTQVKYLNSSLTAWVPTGLTFTPGIWQKYELDLVFDAQGDTFELKVDGQSSGSIAVPMGSTGDAISTLYFEARGDNQARYYIDGLQSTSFTPGDFNEDGAVDTADYTIWADNYTGSGGTGGTPSTGDANGDGAVDTADYTIWADNYTGSQAAAGTVPEPGALCLLLGAMLTLSLFSRRRRPIE